MYLKSQFSGGCEDESKQSLWVFQELMNDGEGKGSSFTGASFCQTNYVTALNNIVSNIYGIP